MEPVTIFVSILATAGASVVLGLAFFGLQQAILLRSVRKFIGTNKTVAIPVADVAIRRGKAAAVKTNEDFVVFFIGAALHNVFDLKAWSLLSSMPKMLTELKEQPESGYLGGYCYSGNPLVFVQYWRSFDHLLAYARNPKQAHFPTWCKIREVWKASEESGRPMGVGFFHETFKVRGGEYGGSVFRLCTIWCGALIWAHADGGSLQNRKRPHGSPSQYQFEPIISGHKVCP
eukprot:jgi/Botrbrau1/21082/Bobra.0144s0080.1